MTLPELLKCCNAIDQLVRETINADVPDTYPILDGIIHPEQYVNARYKILWILKEPVDEIDTDGTPYGGGWSLVEGLRLNQSCRDFTAGQRTFWPMIYIAYGILNNFCKYDDMPYIEDDDNLISNFKSIGYINVSKIPGRKTSNKHTIKYAYQKYKALLLRQLSDYEPDIVIGGSTLYHFFQDLSIVPDEMQQHGSARSYNKDGKIFIDAYHPSQWNMASQEEYCDDIVNAVKYWATY